MELSVTVSAHFDAQHRIADYPPCADPHGHSWTVEATVSGDLDPKSGWVPGSTFLEQDVRLMAEELNRSDLNVLLPGTVTSPLGIAGYFLERLALRFQRLTSVRVSCSDGTAGEVRRTPRQL
ncbi:MAG TPA: 6-carboxytetrahydropterin synthase [Actinomycetes bacterium]|nr:6-carboxytetrahydropterin synthase [Actinomycetes bacterium]